MPVGAPFLVLIVMLLCGTSGNAAAQFAPPRTERAPWTASAQTGSASWPGAAAGRGPAASESILLSRPWPSVSTEFGEQRRIDPERIPLDLRIAQHVRAPAIQTNPVLRHGAALFRSVALPGTLLVAGTLYGAGEITDNARIRDLGAHTGQAIAGAALLTGAGKLIIGRARPLVSPDDPHDVRLGRGIAGDAYQSFPSAHSAIAFASAITLAGEFIRDDARTAVWTVPLFSGVATASSLSRIFHDEHWASDVLAGALIGVFTGWQIVRYHH